ncbi:MAG: hypothetical protein AAGI71_11500 [Bacteroidota bacterium]
MSRLRLVVLLCLAHLFVVTVAVASGTYSLHGSEEGWLSLLGTGLVVAVWTVPMMVFAAVFLSRDVLSRMHR